jgi:hypothetical protein
VIHVAGNPRVEIGDKAGMLVVHAFFVQPVNRRVKRNVVIEQPIDEPDCKRVALRERLFDDFVVTQVLWLGLGIVNHCH